MPNAQDLCGRGTIDPIPSSATSYVYAQGSRAGLIPPEYGQTDGSLPGCRQFADDHSYSWTYNTWTSGVPSGCSWDGQNHVIYNRNLARAEEPMSPSSPYRRICLVELLPPPAASVLLTFLFCLCLGCRRAVGVRRGCRKSVLRGARRADRIV